jgi:hypothetical protein
MTEKRLTPKEVTELALLTFNQKYDRYVIRLPLYAKDTSIHLSDLCFTYDGTAWRCEPLDVGTMESLVKFYNEEKKAMEK